MSKIFSCTWSVKCQILELLDELAYYFGKLKTKYSRTLASISPSLSSMHTSYYRVPKICDTKLPLCLCFADQIFSWACHYGNKLPIQTTIPHCHQQNQTRIQHRNSFLVFPSDDDCSSHLDWQYCVAATLQLYSESQSALGGNPPVIRLPGFHIHLHQTHVLANNKPVVTWAPCFSSDECLDFGSLCLTHEFVRALNELRSFGGLNRLLMRRRTLKDSEKPQGLGYSFSPHESQSKRWIAVWSSWRLIGLETEF